jgi:hypothetical protein
MPSTDSIEVSSSEPAAGAILAAGSEVTFRFRVTCNLVSADSATAIMVLIQQVGSVLEISPTGPSAFTSVGRGTRTVTLTDTVTLRAGTTRINVLVGLQPQGGSGQKDVVVSYPVQ